MPDGLLVLERVSVAFGNLRALEHVSFEVREGEILGVIGPNGAGKSTLFNAISGVAPLRSGAIRFEGSRIDGMPVHAVAARGIARTFQNLRLFRFASALENVMIGAHLRLRSGILDALVRTPRARREEMRVRDEARALLERVGLAGSEERLAANLPYGAQRRLEIARALAARPRLLLLDEPAAGLNPSEKAGLAALIRRIRDDGTTIVLVEHDMGVVMSLCERIVVLDHGETIAVGSPRNVRADRRVIEAYLGSEMP